MKPKIIHLSEETFQTLSILAVKDGVDLKNYIQNHLENFAKKFSAVGAKKKK